MASSRNIIIAGAGIGGLTAALMLARAGFRVTLLEQAARLEGDRRRHPAFAERHPHPDRAWPRRTAARRRVRAGGGRDQDRERRQARPHPARRRGRAPLRRALLVRPSRRPAGGAARGGARKPRYRAAARPAGRGFRRPRPRRQRGLPAGIHHRRRARHRADRRRRTVVGPARPARSPRPTGIPAAHRLARAGARRRPRSGVVQRRGSALARAKAPIWSTTR